MNFVSFFKAAGHDIGVALHGTALVGGIVEPFVAGTPAGPILHLLDSAIIKAEAFYQTPGAGADKKKMFNDEITAGIQFGLAIAGKDPNDQTLVAPILASANKYADMAVGKINSVMELTQMFQHPATAQPAAPAHPATAAAPHEASL